MSKGNEEPPLSQRIFELISDSGFGFVCPGSNPGRVIRLTAIVMRIVPFSAVRRDFDRRVVGNVDPYMHVRGSAVVPDE